MPKRRFLSLLVGFLVMATSLVPASEAKAFSWSCTEWQAVMSSALGVGDMASYLNAQSKYRQCTIDGSYGAIAATVSGCSYYSNLATSALASGDLALYGRYSAAKRDCDINTANYLESLNPSPTLDPTSPPPQTSDPYLDASRNWLSAAEYFPGQTLQVRFSIMDESSQTGKNIFVFRNGSIFASGTASASGSYLNRNDYTWSYTLPTTLPAGSYEVRVRILGTLQSSEVKIGQFSLATPSMDLTLPLGPYVLMMESGMGGDNRAWGVFFPAGFSKTDYQNAKIENSLDGSNWFYAAEVDMESIDKTTWIGGSSNRMYYKVSLQDFAGVWHEFQPRLVTPSPAASLNNGITPTELVSRYSYENSSDGRGLLFSIDTTRTAGYLQQARIGLEALINDEWRIVFSTGLGETAQFQVNLPAGEQQLWVRPVLFDWRGDIARGQDFSANLEVSMGLGHISVQFGENRSVSVSFDAQSTLPFKSITLTCGEAITGTVTPMGEGFSGSVNVIGRPESTDVAVTPNETGYRIQFRFLEPLVDQVTTCTWRTTMTNWQGSAISGDRGGATWGLLAGSNAGLTKTWTKRLGASEAKIYAKNIVGAGKVSFRLNGSEIAWVRAVDATDPKLRIAGGSNYLVRTVRLNVGKNILEVYVDGSRETRTVYSR